MSRLRTLGPLVLLLLLAAPAWAQTPNVWHPYRGGTNCIQVADSQGRFNCAAGTTVDPATGNLTIGGTVTYSSTITFPGGVAVVPTTLPYGNPQVLNGDFVIGKAATSIAPVGPGTGYGVIRLRQSPNGSSCRLVVVVGDSFQEFPVAFINPATGQASVIDLPGGSQGC